MAHIHEVIDSDKCFTIDPITRSIVNDAGNKKTQLIQNDHNSERFAFQLPRYIEGHDMSLSNKVEVHYINLDQSSNERSVGVYEVEDLALSEDNESVLLSWLISNNATKYVGVLSFAICFKCMTNDVIDYSWNTAINSSIQIAKGMYNSEIIIKDYIDVLEAWKEEFMSSIGLSGDCLRAIDPIGTGSFSMNRMEGTDVGTNSVTLGTGCIASGNSCYAEGNYTKASSQYQHVQGKYNIEDTNNTYAHIVGGGTSDTDRKNIHTLDWNGNAVYSGDVSSKTLSINRKEGSTIGQNSVALGQDCTASGNNSHAEGSNTKASGYASHAEGYHNLSGGYTKFDAALGSETIDSTINYYIDVANLDTTLISTNDEIYVLVEDNASAEKRICKIIVSSITEYSTTGEVSTVKHKIHFDENELKNQMSGFPNITIINIYVKNNNNPYSTHAEGKYTTASGDSSHAEGDSTTASGSASHAEGVYTMASGDYGSHAEGEYAIASGHVSHAEGYFTTASGDSSHAEGDYATASGEDSHAEGHKTTASGYASHAEGEYAKASGKYSHAEGYHTTARANSQHVQGKYNIEDTTNTYAHIVGGGTSNTDRKNIHTLDWNGNAVYSGDVNATDSDGSTVSLLGTKWKLKGNAENNNTISLPDNYTELKVMTYKTDQEYPIAYTQTILKDMIDVINKDTIHLYCGNTQQSGASWSINKSAKTIQLTNIENTTQVNNCATYLYYR